MFKLVIEDDDGNKTVVPIIRDEITIGRKDGNTIRLTERNVSRDHARLVRSDGEVYLEEVSARYGTRKNGEKIDGRTDFGVGDIFTIGDYRLTLQSDVAPEAKPPKKPNGAAAEADVVDEDGPPPIPRAEAAKKEGTAIIAADPAKLVIVSSNFAGQEFPLARKEMVIGRGEECDIIIDHRSVSQKHAKVVRETDGEYKIVDLKSKNGVKVGGEDYRAVHLKRGDIVELGHVKFRFVEPGENYVFTPQADDDDVAQSTPKRGMVIAGVLLLLLVVIIAAVGFVNGGKQPEALAVTNTTAGTADPTTAAPSEDLAINPLDAKIDKAEDDYLIGKVQKASGMLELLRDETDITPAQVERIDDLLSKTKREKGFVRYFENGVDHFKAERWMQALAAFQEIPDDDELNIYRLVRDNQYLDKAVHSATEEQLGLAQSADDEDDREDAREKLAELRAMFPNHVAPQEAIAELASASTKSASKDPRPPNVRVKPDRKPKPDNGDGTLELKPKPKDDPKPSKESEQLVEGLYKKAMQSIVKGQHEEARRYAKTAIDNGCKSKCYRVMGMAYHSQEKPDKACSWFAKAGSELPNDLDCP